MNIFSFAKLVRTFLTGALLCPACVFGYVTQAAVDCTPSPSGLVSWWRAENNALDSADGNNGTLKGSATFAAGRVGQGFQFDGNGDVITVGNPTNLHLQNLTIEGWIKRSSASQVTTGPGDGGILFGYTDGGYIFYLGSNSRLYFGKPGTIALPSQGMITDTEYHHVAVTKSNSVVTFYIDGISNSTVNLNVSFVFMTPVGIGAEGATTNSAFFGMIDELSVYNRPLTAGEIQNIHDSLAFGKCPSPPACVPTIPGIVSWWRAESNALDSTDGNNGVLSGNATFTTGRVGGAFRFDGNADLVTVGNPANLHLQNFTIETWIKRADSSVASHGSGNTAVFFGYGDAGYSFYLGGNAHLYFGKLGTLALPSVGIVADTNFHHVAVTKSGSTVVFYIDGVANSAINFPYIFEFITPAAIGARGDNLDNSFLGQIDELSVYNRPLTTNEIQAIFTAGASGKCTSGVAPFITTHPTNQTATVGANVTFSVLAGGTPPLNYQWRFHGTNLSGATGTFLPINNAQPTNAGPYSVVVSNSLGSVTSSVAILTVTLPPQCVPPVSGLVSWWRAENNALDSADGNNGTLRGNTTFAAGRVGQGFRFDGNGDVVTVGNPANLHLQNLTIEGWIKRSSTSQVTTGPGDGGIIFGYTAGGYILYLGSNSRLYFGKPGTIALPSAGFISDTNFHHVAVTKTNSTVRFYIDGALNSTVALGETFVFVTPAAIGAEGATTNSSFFGMIDELAVYNRALTASEIQGIFTADASGKCTNAIAPFITTHPTNQSATVGANVTFYIAAGGTPTLNYQWRRNDTNIPGATSTALTLVNFQPGDAGTYSAVVSNAAGYAVSSNAVLTINPPPPCVPPVAGLVSLWRAETNALDSVDGNDGTLAGNTMFGLGRVGTSFVFDGDQDLVMVGNATNLHLQNLSIEAWIKRGSATITSHGSGGSAIIFGYGDGAYSFYLGGNTHLYFGKLGTEALPSSGTITDTNWHHVAMTKSGSTVTFYIDGVSNSVVNFGHIFQFLTPAAIGARPDNQDNSFLGRIDELGVYNHALTANEIQGIFAAGVSGKCAVNHAPQAKISVSPLTPFPSVTNQVVIAAVCGDAEVVLDGSQSSDADNDALQYVWTDGTNVLSNAATFTNAFAPGTHTIILIVSDGADTGVASTTFEVVTPAEAVGLLMELVMAPETGVKNERPLLATLQAAAAALDRCDLTTALNQLQAFQNKVHAILRSSNPHGAELIAATQAVIDALAPE